jgi:hypothetical protein
MQAIETKYLGATDRTGSRIVAKAQAGRIVVPWDHALDVEQNHRAAAYAYAKRKQWTGHWHGGANAAGTGFVYVCDGLAFAVQKAGEK